MFSKALHTTLAACIISATLGSIAHAKETVTFWGRSNQTSLELLVAAYNKSQDKVNIKLNMIPGESMLTKLSSSIAADSAPDLVALDVSFLPQLHGSEQLVDLTDKIGDRDYIQQLSGSLKTIGVSKGRLYGVPFSAESSFLFYNKKIFRQAGLDPERPPETLQELREYSEKINKIGDGYYGFAIPGTCSGCLAFTLLPYMWANGGDVFTDEGKQSVINSESNKRTLLFFHKMYTDGLMSPVSRGDNSLIDSFASGKIGMVGSGAFVFKVFKDSYPHIEYGVGYYPGEKKGDWASFAGGDALAVPVKSKHQQEAIDFIDWALSKETQIELLAKNGFVPTRMDASDNPYNQKDPRFLLATKALANGRSVYLPAYNEAISAPSSPFLTMLQKSIFEGDVDNALNTADQKFKQIIKMSQE
ncbi:sugar ABC transporter substrate-binding protein [Superficieibacter sp.]|uniref:ABC transporter substrate-binding protein n=1 Tax=Superficieibacter sp. TaxID=2303322 RepID=UPI0028AF4A60|nr:sugar ABC transporter substrate-binding protein [Superficieibacter sp.]